MKKNETIADLIKNRFGVATSAGEDMEGFDELANILNHRSHRRYQLVGPSMGRRAGHGPHRQPGLLAPP